VPHGLEVQDITVMRRREELHIYVVAKGSRRLYFFKVRNNKAEFKADTLYGFEDAVRREDLRRRLFFNTPHKVVVIADGEDIYFKDIDMLMNNQGIIENVGFRPHSTEAFAFLADTPTPRILFANSVSSLANWNIVKHEV
jgi:hypothetical protein